MNILSRRHFIRTTSAGAALAAFNILPSLKGEESPGNQIRIGVMGTSRNSIGGDGRGTELAAGLATLPGVRVTYICDVDERNIPKAIESVVTKGKQEQPPKGVKDFRQILDDQEVDALVIAAPDHWHAPAAILACAAGKHVYVEKPCSHNPREGELLVAAARKYKRHVQHGTQRRSWPVIQEAMHKLHDGAIGRILFAHAWYYGPRPSIGRGKNTPVPSWLDYTLWQGPAPERPYQDNLVHYNWHWFWHYGTAELGNNGVHFLDLCRWGLKADYPLSVTSAGGKYRFPDDDQETPDTVVASMDFGTATVTWEQRSWAPRTLQDPRYDIAFHGENGLLIIGGSSYTICDLKGKEVDKVTGNGGNNVHLQNFVNAIREREPLTGEIEEGHKSTLLCHLGNIAHRTGHTIRLDPKTCKIVGNPQAEALWKRAYRRGWEPKV